jgi:hypothetical protein
MPERTMSRSGEAGEDPANSVEASGFDHRSTIPLLEPQIKDSSQGTRIEGKEFLSWVQGRNMEEQYARQKMEMEVELRLREGKFQFEKQLVLFRLFASSLVFVGGVILALNQLQEIGLFILGCATALLSDTKGGAK